MNFLIRPALSVLAFAILAMLASVPASAGGLVLNELSNGPSGAKEYFEFIVVGDAASPTGAVNLDRWIIDDNNGDWGGSLSGIGISAGYLRLNATGAPAACSRLAAMAPGSMVVIYNPLDVDPKIAGEDTTDANGDGVYILSAEGACMTGCEGPPDSTTSSYSGCSPVGTLSYTKIALGNSADAGQARRPDGTLFHGFAYGAISAPYPAGSFNVDSGSGIANAYVFACGDWHQAANFSKIAATANTHGATNGSANALFRSRIAAGTFDYASAGSAANCAATARLSITKSSSVVNDPIDGTSNPKSIPDAELAYSIAVANVGNVTPDANSVIIIDTMPPQARLFVGALAAGAPYQFSDGTPSSALTCPFVTLASTTDCIDFSANGGTTFDYVPAPDAAGYDTAISAVRFRMTGTFNVATGSGTPQFVLQVRARIN